MPILIFTTGITLDYLFLEPQRRRSSSGTRPSLTGRRTTRRPTWWSLRSAAASRSHLGCHQAWWWADTALATKKTGSDWAGLGEPRWLWIVREACSDCPTPAPWARHATKSTQYLLYNWSAKTQEWFSGWEEHKKRQIKYCSSLKQDQLAKRKQDMDHWDSSAFGRTNCGRCMLTCLFNMIWL